jgi:hypothetical protein
MFSNLGLLRSGKCPDGDTCTRARCFFSHGPADRSNSETGTGSPSRKPVEIRKRPVDNTGESSSKRSIGDTSNTMKSPISKISKIASVQKVWADCA